MIRFSNLTVFIFRFAANLLVFPQGEWYVNMNGSNVFLFHVPL